MDGGCSEGADFFQHRRKILVIERHQFDFRSASKFDRFGEPARRFRPTLQAAGAASEVVRNDGVVREFLRRGDQQIKCRFRTIQFGETRGFGHPAKLVVGRRTTEGLADFQGSFPLLILRANLPSNFQDIRIVERFEAKFLELLSGFGVVAVAQAFLGDLDAGRFLWGQGTHSLVAEPDRWIVLKALRIMPTLRPIARWKVARHSANS